MNSDQYQNYATVCRRLAALSLDLSNSGRCHPAISHQLFLWPHVQSPLCAELWTSLITSQKRKLPRDSTEIKWDCFPDGTGCSRYFGVRDEPGLQQALEKFMQLAQEGQRILDAYWELKIEGPYSWNLPHRYPPCYIGGHYDWLTLVCEQSLENFFSPGKLRHVIPTLPGWETAKFRFNLLQQHNLFPAAAEALENWLPCFWDHPIEPANVSKDRPRWDADEQVLWFGAAAIKRYEKVAHNQFILLEAFEAASWKRTIEAPPCFLSSASARTTLRQTVDGLNRLHVPPAVIHFGKRGVWVTWEPVGQS